MTIEEIRTTIEQGEWASIAPEIRPSTVKTEAGDIKPLYCSRKFLFPGDDRFQLTFTNFADPYGKVPLVTMQIKGHILFGQPHPIADGAYELDYFADESFEITIHHPGFAAAIGWEAGQPKEVRGKSVPAFGLKQGEDFKEFDLIYIYKGLLFNGSRNVDGRPFDPATNRPTNLQVPLVRKS